MTKLFNRREALGATAGGVVACSMAPARAAQPLRRFTHGAFEIIVASDGHLVLPTAFLAPDAQPAERAAALAAAQQTGREYQSPTNVTLIRTPNDLILVDIGSGDRFMPTAGKLWENLEAAGIDKDKITKVMLTHGHPDHIWGMVDELDDMRLPKASYYVAAAEWDFWHSENATRGLPAEREGFVTGARRNLAQIKDRVTMLKDGDEISPGIRAISTPGHTQGHISLELAGNDGLVITADALTHAQISFQHPEWRMPGDHESERAVQTRKRLLDQMASRKSKLIGFHLPYPGVGVVERKDNAYRFVPA